jgi:predicted methyltransferase
VGLAAAPAGGEEWRQRDRWQRPAEVMDVLGVTRGAAVADVGAGDGYFTLHLARRVGPAGRVYAVDLRESELEAIRRRARQDRLAQVETVRGEPGDPRLPPDTLDAALVVNTYHEMAEHDAMLQGLWRALRPGGRLGIIDKVAEPGQPREAYAARHAIPADLVRRDAERQGFRFVREAQGFNRPRGGGEAWYYLVFEKAAATSSSRTSARPS